VASRGPKKAGQAKAEATGGTGKGNESCEEETGCTRHPRNSPGSQAFYANRNEISDADVEEANRQQKSEKKTQSLTRTPCPTCGRDESHVGREESR